ncbi:hypothetical protein FQZ97_836540 [compost metagenome]
MCQTLLLALTGSRKWIWVPGRPAGCGPAKDSTLTWARPSPGRLAPSALQRKTRARRARTLRPCSKSAGCSAITTAGSAANGWVSMAVTKIELGTASMAGTRLNGRVRRAVQRPDCTRLSRTCWASRPSSRSAGYCAKRSSSSPSRSITTDCSTRCSPRWMALITPAPGAV